ncbi:MAG TPA: site-2 protease family protein [Leptolyngbyaceae cyanobacterium M33_DOE_097]|uniref:Site-2 protease family protein n=1 Tax=Oscillatoriales cyanobacterium SpSt-418 TaxID=2282169 RepID=A0A7C3KDI2_9CYAN|nr:site-2 protease family protein [Leptolyngbyaceae cyanobacterium M33_DOE_097]
MNSIPAVIVLAALGFLSWGFYRARPFGKLGVLAWLQSLVLIAPWLVFFGLFAAGIYLNLVGMLLLFILSTAVYIYLGRQLRALGKDVLARRASELAQTAQTAQTTPDAELKEPIETETKAALAAELAGEVDVVPIPPEDLQAVKSIFGIDTFFATETIPYQEGAIFRGNLRGDVEETFDRLSESLKAKVGDRYRLFLLENQDAKPVVIVLPSSRDPQPSTTFQKIFSVILLFVTIAASFESGGIMMGFDFFTSPERYAEVLPLALGIVSILAVHEIGHWVLAKRYNMRLSLPFFIPTWQLGSFGSLTRIESLIPNRTALFDVAIAGPAAGGLLSFGMLIIGLVLSHKGSLFQVPTEFFQGSILVGTLARVVLRESLQEPLVDVNPLVILGWLGLVINALNLIPAGQLDGGRMVQAVYGRKTASRTTIGTLIFLGLASLVNPLALYWAIVVLFLQRELERPALNDLTEPDDARAALCLLALFLTVVTLLPLTPSLAGRLGIGG